MSKQESKEHGLSGSPVQRGHAKIRLVQNKPSSLEQFPILNRGGILGSRSHAYHGATM